MRLFQTDDCMHSFSLPIHFAAFDPRVFICFVLQLAIPGGECDVLNAMYSPGPNADCVFPRFSQRFWSWPRQRLSPSRFGKAQEVSMIRRWHKKWRQHRDEFKANISKISSRFKDLTVLSFDLDLIHLIHSGPIRPDMFVSGLTSLKASPSLS